MNFIYPSKFGERGEKGAEYKQTDLNLAFRVFYVQQVKNVIVYKNTR